MRKKDLVKLLSSHYVWLLGSTRGKQLNLSYSSVQQICLDRPVFRKAFMTGIELTRVSFIGADFSYSILKGAIISRSNMRNADFSYCDLSGVYFDECDLRDAKFTGAILDNTDFRSSKIYGTIFDKCDTSNCHFVSMQADQLSASEEDR